VLDDGQEIKVPVLLNGTESVMEFIDIPYPGVSQHRLSIVDYLCPDYTAMVQSICSGTAVQQFVATDDPHHIETVEFEHYVVYFLWW